MSWVVLDTVLVEPCVMICFAAVTCTFGCDKCNGGIFVVGVTMVAGGTLGCGALRGGGVGSDN